MVTPMLGSFEKDTFQKCILGTHYVASAAEMVLVVA
jgi:hypothetical protein